MPWITGGQSFPLIAVCSWKRDRGHLLVVGCHWCDGVKRGQDVYTGQACWEVNFPWSKLFTSWSIMMRLPTLVWKTRWTIVHQSGGFSPSNESKYFPRQHQFVYIDINLLWGCSQTCNTRSLVLDRRSIDLSGAQEKEGHYHYKTFLRASKWGITCHPCSIIPKTLYWGLGLSLIHSKGILWWLRRYGYVIPHFKALEKVL